MIKNRAQLMAHLSPDVMRRRKILLSIVDHVLGICSPKILLKKSIEWQTFSNLRQYKKIVVIAFGKAAHGMTQGLLPMLKRKLDAIFIADKGHPLPTKQSLTMTKKIIACARSLTKDDLAIVLISGGGSAMLTAPAPGITLDDKISVTKLLLRCGATIHEMNVVRKHLSTVKGGQLATLLYPATVLGFVISDVVGNDLSTIASGPLTPDKSTFSDALKILKKYKVKAPRSVMNYLEKGAHGKVSETPKPSEKKYFQNVWMKIIADHDTAVDAAAAQTKKLKLRTHIVTERVTGEARTMGKKLLHKTKNGRLLIASGETTVTCTGNGYGGRNQELVLGALQFLKKNQTIISIGTDGVDGICPEKICGAIGDAETVQAAKKNKLTINHFLKNNDSYSFFKKTNSLIKTQSTGTNLGDLTMIL